MLDTIFQFFEKLLTDFSWKRLVFVLTLFFLAIVMITAYENYTGHFRLSRIERAAALLDKLATLENTIDKSRGTNFPKIYKSLTDDLNTYVNHRFTPFNLPVWILKGFSAATPWALISLLISITQPDGTKGIKLGIAIGTCLGVGIGMFLPDFKYPWMNYIAYPLVSISLIIGSLMALQRFKTKPS